MCRPHARRTTADRDCVSTSGPPPPRHRGGPVPNEPSSARGLITIPAVPAAWPASSRRRRTGPRRPGGESDRSSRPTMICSSEGPLTGETNSRAGVEVRCRCRPACPSPPGGALSGSLEPLTRYGPVGGTAEEKASVPGTRPRRPRTSWRPRCCCPRPLGDVLATRQPQGRAGLARVIAGDAEEADSWRHRPVTASEIRGKVSMGYCATLPVRQLLDSLGEGRGAGAAVEPALLLGLGRLLEPRARHRVGRVLDLVRRVVLGRLGVRGGDVVEVAEDVQLRGEGVPQGAENRRDPAAALIFSLLRLELRPRLGHRRVRAGRRPSLL